MCLVYDQDTGVWKDGSAPAAPVDGVRQEQIVIADLKKILPVVAIL
jgi:hypothetical protein